MSVILGIIVAIIVVLIGLNWYRHEQIKQKLRWLTVVPGLPYIGNASTLGNSTSILDDLARLIDTHGNLLFMEFFWWPHIFSADYDFTEYILSSHDVLTKSEDYEFLHKWLGTGLLTSEGTKWKKRRRLITPAFHFSILEQFVGTFEAKADILIDRLDKIVGQDIDIYDYLSLFALDVICETAMGVPVEAQKDADSEYVKQVRAVCRIFVNRSLSFFKGNDFFYWFFKEYSEEDSAVKYLHSVTNSVIESRRKKLEQEAVVDPEKDELGRKRKMAFLDILLRSNVDGEPLSNEGIREEVDTIMFAGHDTTSSAMSFALFLLANHPEIQNKALEEQMQIFNDDLNRKLKHADLQEMKYLECVIKESLRLYPPVPLFSRKTDAPVSYKGNLIPKGVDITIVSYKIQRDPKLFPNPDAFDPGRFERGEVKKPYSFIPFSAGARNCLGQRFAMLEMKSVLSKILRSFEILPTSPEHELQLSVDTVLKSRNGVKMKLVKRKYCN